MNETWPRSSHWEGALLTGRQRPQAGCSSLMLFTYHDSCPATGLLAEVARRAWMIPVDFHACVVSSSGDSSSGNPYSWKTPISDEFQEHLLGYDGARDDDPRPGLREQLGRAFQPHGFCYGPLVNPSLVRQTPQIEQFKKLLLLRDPRDVLCAYYYCGVSIDSCFPRAGSKSEGGYTQRPPIASIDDFVLQGAVPLERQYMAYCRNLGGQPNVFCASYETLVTESERWLQAVMQFWGVPLDGASRRKLVEETPGARRDAPPWERPGYYREALRPETIDRLNRHFAKVLPLLGYSRDKAAA